MTKHVHVDTEKAKAILAKSVTDAPAIILLGTNSPAVRGGTVFGSFTFTADKSISPPPEGFIPGADYRVFSNAGDLSLARASSLAFSDQCLGGFHFASGGNATARTGGDTMPAINPKSIWDLHFRSAADTRSAALVEMPGRRFWTDIYPCAKDHLEGGTSQFNVAIADGDNPPQNPKNGYFDNLDYETAMAVMAHHGKKLHAFEEMAAAGYGVTERTVAKTNPRNSVWDAARTSQCGATMMTGNKWWWINDGDPDDPRASLCGGSYLDDGYAGSRGAYLGSWPGGSRGYLGARGRGDHLQLV